MDEVESDLGDAYPKIFEGEFESTVICDKCKTTNTPKVEEFKFLQMSIMRTDSKQTVNSGIESITADANVKWDCTTCKTK